MKAEDQQQEYERIAYEAATQAIRESFKMIFGIDVNDRQDVADLRDDLMTLKGDEGAKSVIVRHRARLRLVPLPARHATTDLDTPEDWAAWRATQSAAGR